MAETLPAVLPAADAVVNVAMVREHMVATRARGEAVPGALFSIQFDSTGALRSVRPVEPRSESQELRELTSVIEGSVRQQAPGRRWGLLIRVDPEGQDVRIGRSEECPPVLLNRREVERELLRGMSAATISRIAAIPVRHVQMHLKVDSAGAVTEVRPQTLTMVGELDSLAVHVSRKMVFHPALINREPTPVWVSMPVNFRADPGEDRGAAPDRPSSDR